MTACIRGCTRLRLHLVDCEDREECKGCLPRSAEYGNLCWPCHRRYQLMLHDAPTVYDWLTGNLAAGQGAAPQGDYVTGKSRTGSPAPIKVGIFDVRQLLADSLAENVDELCEREKLTGPDRHSVKADSEYLTTWLDRIEKWEFVGDWWEHLAELMRDAHALAPWRPEARRQHGIPCPECQECSLAIFGGEDDVTCLRCRTMMTPAQFNLWKLALKQEAERVSA